MQIKVKAKVWDKGIMPGIDPYKIYDAILLPDGKRISIEIDSKRYTMSINNTGYLVTDNGGQWEIISNKTDVSIWVRVLSAFSTLKNTLAILIILITFVLLVIYMIVGLLYIIANMTTNYDLSVLVSISSYVVEPLAVFGFISILILLANVDKEYV